jgi:hypothetical protein
MSIVALTEGFVFRARGGIKVVAFRAYVFCRRRGSMYNLKTFPEKKQGTHERPAIYLAPSGRYAQNTSRR